jgi:hypothetical protein
MSDGKRPTVATVFAVLNIVFGGFGLLAALGIGLAFQVSTLLGVYTLVGVVLALLEVYSGIMLLTNKKSGVGLTQLYAFASLAMTAAYTIYMVVTIGGGYISTAITSVVLGALYPLLLIFLVVRNEGVKSFYASR